MSALHPDTLARVESAIPSRKTTEPNGAGLVANLAVNLAAAQRDSVRAARVHQALNAPTVQQRVLGHLASAYREAQTHLQGS